MQLNRDEIMDGWRLLNASPIFRQQSRALSRIPGINARETFNLIHSIFNGDGDNLISCITTGSQYWLVIRNKSPLPLKGGMKLSECVHPVLARVFLSQRKDLEAHHLYARLTLAMVELHLTDLTKSERDARFTQFHQAVSEGIKLCSMQMKRFLRPHGIAAEVIELLVRNYEAALILETWATANELLTPRVVGIRFFRREGLHPLWINKRMQASCLVIPVKP